MAVSHLDTIGFPSEISLSFRPSSGTKFMRASASIEGVLGVAGVLLLESSV